MDWLNELLGFKKRQMPQRPVPNMANVNAPEDSAIVQAGQRTMPLSDVGRGQQFLNPNTMTIGGGMGRQQAPPPQPFMASQQRPRAAEDSGLVQSGQRMMPLSDVGRGQLFVDPNSMTIGGMPRPRRRSSLEDLLNF